MTSSVVVVNDDPTQITVLCGLLRKAGLKPHGFTSAEEALDAMSASAGSANGDPLALPALVVTDLYMPGIDGFRLCRLLRSPEYAAFNQVPILVVSATFAGEETDRIAAELGAETFLPSPVNGTRFIEQVRGILSGKRVRVLPRVLIVDDSRTVIRILGQAFAAHGYQADSALTAKEGTAAFALATYDVAILDYHLPDGTGDALLDAFRATRPDCVCIMITTDPGPELALDWMRRGAAAYLRKPFEPDYLIELCTKARRERALLRIEDLLEARTRELRESEHLLRQSQAIAGLGSYVLDIRTGLWKSSAVLDQVFGIGDTYERSVDGWAALIHPDDRAMMVEYFGNDVLGQGLAFDKEYRIVSHESRVERWVHGAGKLEFDTHGRPEKMHGTIQDITERKRTAEEREKLQAQLNQAQKMESVGRLAGGVAHDFNNMLGAILGHAELALEQVDSTHALYADLEEIRSAAMRSSDLTRQLLAFARKQTVAPKVLDLNETIAGMLKMLGRLIGENINLVWQPHADLWPVRVDPSQIDQILANLCVNARDAIAGVGRMTIETENTVLDQDYCAAHAGFMPGEYVRLSVSDDGCGMDQATLAHIFEPFFTTKGVGHGTGLGLATVYGAVKQNHGFINVYSEPGHGTTFTIYLPRHTGKAGEKQTAGTAGQPVRGHETILLVEDEPSILKLTTTMLERQGYTVLVAHTPGEAIRVARDYADEIHLLMTDVVMPEMNGRDLARNLLSLYPHIARLFMSGYTPDVIAHQGVLDDGVFFIQKPFSIKDLAAKVRDALQRD